MDIKTIWTFDPFYNKATQANLERILSPEVVRWLFHNYPLARDQLDTSSLANSAGRHEGAQTCFAIAGEPVWMCVCLNVCRTIPSDCWVCVGPHDFVRESYDHFMDRWEKWNRKHKHRAAVLERDVSS
jgi:hypothetical protein